MVAASVIALLIVGNPAQAPGPSQRPDTTVINATVATHPSGATVEQVWRFGAPDGAAEYRFTRIQEVFVTRDGNVWIVGDTAVRRGRPDLRVYDPNGKFVGHVGATGTGPGQYTSIGGIGQLPDGRMLVRDVLQSRINVYKADGTPDTTWHPFKRDVWFWTEPGGIRVDVNGVVWMLMQSTFEHLTTAPYLRVARNGAVLDTVSMVRPPYPERQAVVMKSANSTAGIADPSAVSNVVAVSPRGYFATFAPPRYAFELHEPRRGASAWRPGDPVVSIRRNVPPVAMVDEEWKNFDAILRSQIEFYRGRGMEIDGGVPEIPHTKPAIRAINFGADARMWITVSAPGETVANPKLAAPWIPLLRWRDPPVYDVFEPGGDYVGRVALPSGEDAVFRRGDFVWSVSREVDSVSYLTKYRVVWR